MILLIPYAAFLNKLSQVNVLEKFKSISFTKLRGTMAVFFSLRAKKFTLYNVQF